MDRENTLYMYTYTRVIVDIGYCMIIFKLIVFVVFIIVLS